MSALVDANVSESGKVARQVEFDALVSQLMEEGSLLEDAVAETIDILQEDEQDLNYLYIYRSEEEKKDKENLVRILQTMEKTARGEDTQVNCLFSFQGLKQALMCEDKQQATFHWRMSEGRGIVRTLVKLLGVNDEKDDSSDNDEDSDVDEDEDEIVFVLNALQMLSLLSKEGCKQNYLRSPERAFSLDQESMGCVLARLDKHQDESRVAVPLLSFILVLLSQNSNKILFVEGRGVGLVEFTLKLNKKNAEIASIGEKILSICAEEISFSG